MIGMAAASMPETAPEAPIRIIASPQCETRLVKAPPVAETPAKQTDVPPTKTTPGLYHVKKGDTAFSIAKTYGLKPEEILAFNKITDAKKIQLNQALKIPPKKG